ncbi:DoxX family protein [Gordonia hydrophobica]|uniref:DoxX family protein n=1 Tax=Gordonia hydrophobica TaxID=40516 RepID=A0ABZ2TZ47_9ACTN|nr:DoxX family protein [Gordonia hydrophobica]MBM7367238.1 putative membrane protein YphA (DoxX/SURF4 family) [Gordonia hydrophobica]
MLLRKIARPLLGTAFIASGIDAVRSPSGPASAAEPLLQSAPVEPTMVIQAAGAVQIGAGLALATGRAPRVASTVLVGTLVPTTVFASDFWNETDPARKSVKQSAFAKNLGLLGAALIAAADTEGKPSLGWRGRRRLERAGAAIESVRSNHTDDPGVLDAWSEKAEALSGKADAWAGKADTWAGKASDTASDLAARVPVDDIKSTVSHVADATRSRLADTAGPGLAEVRRRAEEIAGEVTERAPEVAADARDLSVAAGQQAARRARRWRRELAG